MIGIRKLWIGLALLLAACGGGSDGIQPTACDGACQDAGVRLEVSDVETVIAQAVNEAQARNATAAIAVTDRVGNVLAVYLMDGVSESFRVDSGRGVVSGLDGLTLVDDQTIPDVPAGTFGNAAAAIAKAITGAYLSSEGNAFSTRTASQIVQENFNPGETNQPSGPLFGVQFSSLPCSDLSTRFSGDTAGAGPQRSPLGLSADPGGLPLYKNGTVVGGIGVMADGLYSLDLSIGDRDRDIDELIAIAGSFGFEPPNDRRGDRITVDGKTFRFSDADRSDLASNPDNAPAFASLDNIGTLVAVPSYSTGGIRAGTRFGFAESGYQPAGSAFADLDAFVLVDDQGNERFAPRDATDADVHGAPLTTAEVTQLIRSAIEVANRGRAQIRRPLGSPIRVTVSVVDTYGAILGIARTRDGPVFGTDVSLQKARTATFFSNAAAADDLFATPNAEYFDGAGSVDFTDYVNAVRLTLSSPTALGDGAFAFADRSGGNLSRPFFPDGNSRASHGPLSKPLNQWSPFSTGLQLDLVNNAILQHVLFLLGQGPDVEVGACTQMPNTPSTPSRLSNGAQIFPGSVPIYRGTQLVGGIGVSGDGVDQDDMISFLGLHNAGLALGGTIGNAPKEIRADQLQPNGSRLRYVQCPQAPFTDSDEQNPCLGK